MCIQRTAELEKQLTEMRERAHKAELSQSEATETAKQLREKEELLKEKVNKLQGEIDKMRMESRKKMSTLQVHEHLGLQLNKSLFGGHW